MVTPSEPTSGQHAYLLFTPPSVTPEAATALIEKVRSLVEAGTSSITLLISSPGGHVNPGILAYNFLKGSPVDVTTHNINVCDSITAVIYAAGNRRLSVPHGRFLLHSIKAGFGANVNLSETELEERLATLRNEADNIAGVLSGATGKPEVDIHDDMRKGLTLDPQQAVQYGLAHEIVETIYPAGATVIRVA